MDYSLKTTIQLKQLCKINNIEGYNNKKKNELINLINDYSKNNIIKEGNIIQKSMLEIKKEKNNLYDFLQKYDSKIINKFNGSIDDMKKISKGTMKIYEWRCDNFEKCKNTYFSRPINIYRSDRLPHRYCKECRVKEKVKKHQKNMLLKNGSLLDALPNINKVWSSNNEYLPEQLTRQSHKKVKLKCLRAPSHPEYEIYVYNIQDNYCNICPKCTTMTSKAEIRIYTELVNIFKDVRWQDKINNYEADIIVEDLKLVIEVDGYPWHNNKEQKDLNKNNIFKINGYHTVRIRDTQLKEIKCDNIICNVSKFRIIDFNMIIKWINNKYKLNIEIYNQFNNDILYNNTMNSILNVKYEDSIEYLFPESKEIWDYEKNKPFLPSQFTKGSHTEVWIKCKNNHSYKKEIKLQFRIIKGNKKLFHCPECPKIKS